MMWNRQPVDIAELRRKANSNLVKVYDGTHKREQERIREAEARIRERSKIERKERRDNIIAMGRRLKTLRKKLAEYEKEWKWLFDMNDDQLNEVGDFTVPNIVVLEEVDATRNNLCEEIVALENDLWDTKHLRH